MTETLDLALGAGRHARVSALSVAGSADQPNEDAFGLKRLSRGVLLGVFDGLTTLRRADQESASGELVSGFLGNRLRSARDEEGADLHRLLTEWNREVGELLTLGRDLPPWGLGPASSATVSFIDAVDQRIQVAHVYDSFALAFYRDGSDARLTSDRNEAFDEGDLRVMQRIAHGKGVSIRDARNDPAVLEAWLRSRVHKLNRPDGQGVGVINGDPDCERYIERVTLDLSQVEALILGTDGFVPPGIDLNTHRGRRALLDTARRDGLARIVEANKTREDGDPSWATARFKHSDDATAILVELATDS